MGSKVDSGCHRDRRHDERAIRKPVRHGRRRRYWVAQRRGDFRRLLEMAETRRIDGLHAIADMGEFRDDLADAARRLGMLP